MVSFLSMTVDEELSLGEMTETLPCIDMHGEFSAAVPRLVDDIIALNPGAVVRIIVGKGTGVLRGETMRYLEEMLRWKDSPILGYKNEIATHGGSFVIRVR